MRAVFRLSCILGAGAVVVWLPEPAHAAPLCEGPPAALMPLLPGLPNGCQRERIQVSGGLSFNVFRKAASLAELAWQREVIARYGERFADPAVAACKSVLCEKGAVSGTERCAVSAYPCASDMDVPQKEQVARLSSMDAAPPPVPLAPPPGVDARRQEEEKTAQGEKAAQEEKESRAAKATPEAAPQAEEKAPEPVQEKEWVKEKEPPREVERELTIQEVREMQRYLSRAGYNVHADGIFGDESRDALSAWERRAGLPDNGYPTYEMLERLRRDVH